jgi:S-adenosylmethionine:tRNA ribosyltransferase-isomerase
LAFTYTLPKDRIAIRPVTPPDCAKLLVATGEDPIKDLHFSDLSTLDLNQTLFVFNDTAVIKARFFGSFYDSSDELLDSGEVLLISEIDRTSWKAMGRPKRAIEKASKFKFEDEIATLINGPDGEFTITFSHEDALKKGVMPIPPYIRDGRGDSTDEKDYQTIFAKHLGSIAAPTASLHFTYQLVVELERFSKIEYLTLHVGTYSFRSPHQYAPGKERFFIADDVWRRIKEHRSQGGQVVAVGTTAVRALESKARGMEGNTELILTPGDKFLSVDKIITNFHQPGSTHLLLIEAFVGAKRLKDIYEHGLTNNYRFLSYGDGMLLG